MMSRPFAHVRATIIAAMSTRRARVLRLLIVAAALGGRHATGWRRRTSRSAALLLDLTGAAPSRPFVAAGLASTTSRSKTCRSPTRTIPSRRACIVRRSASRSRAARLAWRSRRRCRRAAARLDGAANCGRRRHGAQHCPFPICAPYRHHDAIATDMIEDVIALVAARPDLATGGRIGVAASASPADCACRGGPPGGRDRIYRGVRTRRARRSAARDCATSAGDGAPARCHRRTTTASCSCSASRSARRARRTDRRRSTTRSSRFSMRRAPKAWPRTLAREAVRGCARGRVGAAGAVAITDARGQQARCHDARPAACVVCRTDRRRAGAVTGAIAGDARAGLSAARRPVTRDSHPPKRSRFRST